MQRTRHLGYINRLIWPAYYSSWKDKKVFHEVGEEGGNLSFDDFALYPHASLFCSSFSFVTIRIMRRRFSIIYTIILTSIQITMSKASRAAGRQTNIDIP
jgi:hypothetical protein